MLEKLKEVKSAGLSVLDICKSAGVSLELGTDLLGDMHVHQLEELKLRSEVQTPYEVLHSAIAINAKIIQRPEELDCVKVGAYADLPVIDGNPLEDLSLL